ncbi:MAG: MarR family transcriptional regulator [Chloroflexi bacterium]|nr:MarR family transcriptional regulator [Chloroflexota bacterium]
MSSVEPMAFEPTESPESLALAERLLAVFDIVIKVTELRLPDALSEMLNLNQIRTMYLLRYETGLSQKEIAERLGLTPAAISKLVREMEHNGFVERHPDEHDARQMKLHLSDFGQNVVTHGEAMRVNAIAKVLSALSLDERRLVVELLERALEITQANGDN